MTKLVLGYSLFTVIQYFFTRSFLEVTLMRTNQNEVGADIIIWSRIFCTLFQKTDRQTPLFKHGVCGMVSVPSFVGMRERSIDLFIYLFLVCKESEHDIARRGREVEFSQNMRHP